MKEYLVKYKISDSHHWYYLSKGIGTTVIDEEFDRLKREFKFFRMTRKEAQETKLFNTLFFSVDN